jgi:universal stress protein E
MGKILVVADLPEKCSATPRGLQLAAKLGFSVEVVVFAYAPLKRLGVDSKQQTKIKQRLMAERETVVQARIDKYASTEQTVSLKVVWAKDIHPWIVARAAKGFAAVIKTGNQAHLASGTSTDWHLLRECYAPVLLVADKKWHKTNSILAAVDLGTKNKRKRALNHSVVAHAKLLADALEAPLNLIYAIDVPTILTDMDLIDPAAYVRDQKEAMQPRLQELAAAHDISPKLFRCKRGPVAKVINSEAARVRAQLVVIGTLARQGIAAHLIGNTAEEVLSHLHTDILTLKS